MKSPMSPGQWPALFFRLGLLCKIYMLMTKLPKLPKPPRKGVTRGYNHSEDNLGMVEPDCGSVSILERVAVSNGWCRDFRHHPSYQNLGRGMLGFICCMISMSLGITSRRISRIIASTSFLGSSGCIRPEAIAALRYWSTVRTTLW
jgi:hypothetical protein